MTDQARPQEQAATRPLGLDAGPLRLLFSDDALAQGAAVDLFRGDAVVFHLKYLTHRQGFVVNDRHAGTWGAEVFVGLAQPPGPGGIAVTLAMEDAAPWLCLPGGLATPLGGRFDLSGQLRASIPASIGTGPLLAKAAPIAPPATAWDALVVSDAGVFLEGWSDDRAAPLLRLVLDDPAGGGPGGAALHRQRRPDIEDQLHPATPYEFGLWAAVPLPPGHGRALPSAQVLTAAGAGDALHLPPPTVLSAAGFLDFLLAHFGRRRLLGDLTARSLADLDAGHGAMLAGVHARVAAADAVRLRAAFGPQPSRYRLSLVCVLFGVADLLYLLVSQFARFGTLDGIEFVFVSNSPELEEALVRDAELAGFVFAARIVLLGMNRNSGFGHANNVGVAEARAATVCLINPDVYPRDADAVAHLLHLAQAGLGPMLAGGRLHYADGSVMHEGMRFAEDLRLSALAGGPVWSVEHDRKGFPDTGDRAMRPVPAVSGALMLLDKALFDRVGGFDTGYIHGYYEDADLCLRLRQAGAEVVVDPRLGFWHYEGRGSAGQPAGAGARLYNRWRFTRRWGDQLGQARDA